MVFYFYGVDFEKKILLGVGGLKTFQKSKPFFVGLVLGDCIIGGVWAIVGEGVYYATRLTQKVVVHHLKNKMERSVGTKSYFWAN